MSGLGKIRDFAGFFSIFIEIRKIKDFARDAKASRMAFSSALSGAASLPHLLEKNSQKSLVYSAFCEIFLAVVSLSLKKAEQARLFFL